MSNCDPEGRILLSVPYTLDLLFFLQTFHFLKWMFEIEVTSTAEVRCWQYHDFSDLIPFSDVNLNDSVPWRPI